MLTQPAPHTDLSVGCVLRVEDGVYLLLCGAGSLRATLGGELLQAMARDPDAGPCAGDWCLVRSWPDGPHTLERVLTPHRRARDERCPTPHPRGLRAVRRAW